MSHGRRVAMVDPHHEGLSIARQCRLVSIARSSFYYENRGESPLNLELMRRIDEQFLEKPFLGSRQMTCSEAGAAPRLLAARTASGMNHQPGVHLSRAVKLSDGWGPLLWTGRTNAPVQRQVPTFYASHPVLWGTRC